MDIINISLSSTPLSSKYEGDEDLKFISVKHTTEEGISFFDERYLKNVKDRKLNNYSLLFLTEKQKADNFLHLDAIFERKDIESFSTSIIDDNTGLVFTISSINDNISYIFTEKDQDFIDPSDQIVDITILSGLSAKISHKHKNRNLYHLNYNTSNGFFLSTEENNNIFKCILDKKNNKISFFKTINNALSSVILSNFVLSLTSNNKAYKTERFTIHYYLETLQPRLNTTWVSYDTKNVNNYKINNEKSAIDLKNNYLISTQYSYITGDTLNCNILTLKNQKTNNNYSYRSNYLEKNHPNNPNVDNRNYTGLFTGNEQELGDYSISLNYEFYNSDYKFDSDKYTIFITPESLYPYEQININDLNWNFKGSLAGETPYLSDKIFQNKLKNSKNGEQYLCSWLFKKKNGESIWLDRYYYPDKTSYAEALNSLGNYTYIDPIKGILNSPLTGDDIYDVPHIYNTVEEEFQNTPQTVKNALYGRPFFDKMSDLTILPDNEYIYHRIGNLYVKEILESLNEYLITSKLELKDAYGSKIELQISDIDEAEYIFDNNTYSSIKNYNDVNNSHQFTISFWLKMDDWTKKSGHQIFGNLNDKGFSLLDDQQVTPTIILQQNNKLYIYNTDFVNLDVASLENEAELVNSKIKDIYRTDHLDSFYAINIE